VGSLVVTGTLGDQELKVGIDTGDDGGLTLPTNVVPHLTTLEQLRVIDMASRLRINSRSENANQRKLSDWISDLALTCYQSQRVV